MEAVTARTASATPLEATLFSPLLATPWGDLPPVFHKAYAHRQGSRDVVVLRGVLRCRASRGMKLAAPLLRWLGSVPVFSAKSAEVTLRITADAKQGGLHYQWELLPQESGRYVRFSAFQHIREGAAVWQHGKVQRAVSYQWSNGRIVARHRGYRLRWLERWLGQCHGWMQPEGDNRFSFQLLCHRPRKRMRFICRGMFEVVGVLRKD